MSAWNNTCIIKSDSGVLVKYVQYMYVYTYEAEEWTYCVSQNMQRLMFMQDDNL